MKKNVTIDRLRGFCVLAVVCMHAAVFFPNVLTFLGRALSNGYFGVTAFFCTSGFLITTTILRRYGQVAKVDLYAFYVMRFARIVPALVLLCLTLSLLSTTSIERFRFQAPLNLREALVYALTLRSNVYYTHGGGGMVVWAILWSLSIEEVFYLGYPLVAKTVRRTLGLVAVLLGVIAAALIHRRGDITTIYDYFGCFDGIAWGALSALAAQRFSGRTARPVAWLLMLAGLAVMVGTYAAVVVGDHYNLGLTLIATGAALVLYASQCLPFVDTRPSAYDPVAFLGRLSYEMYLFHATVFALLDTIIVARYPIVVFGVAMLCVVTVSDLIARLYAEPLNRGLRTWLLSARRPRVAAAGPEP